MKVRALVVFALAVVLSIPVIAQTTCSTTLYTNTLICTIPQLFGPQGLRLSNPNHVAHFADKSDLAFHPLTQGIGQELSILPLGSSGSGTTFKLDSEGHPIATEDSLGPILTERANVIGRNAFTLGVAYQYFSFEKIDGVDLKSFQIVLTHDSWTPTLDPTSFKQDHVVTSNEAHVALNQTVIYAVYGITNHMDASIELPIQSAHLRVVSSAHIVRTQPCEITQNCVSINTQTGLNEAVCGEFHYFTGEQSNCSGILGSVNAKYPFPGAAGLITVNGAAVLQPLRSAAPLTDASGIGDVTLRVKYEVIRGEKFVGSVGLGVRFPSGDAKNFLGTGAYGVTPFGALTYRSKFSPHVRFGYEWNSHSVLAGDPLGLTGAPPSASLPPAWLYSGGVDYHVSKRVTLGADLIGQWVLSASRLTNGSFDLLPQITSQTTPTAADKVPIPSVLPATGSYGSDAIAAGGKVRLYGGTARSRGELVLTGNATIRVDDGGLRANVVPLVGLSWSR